MIFLLLVDRPRDFFQLLSSQKSPIYIQFWQIWCRWKGNWFIYSKKIQQKFSMSTFVLKYAIVWFRRVLKKHKIGSNFSETPRGAKKRYLGRCVMTKYIRKTSLDFNSFTTPEQSLQKTEISIFYFLTFLIITSKTINLHLKPYKLYINRKLIVSAI